MNDAILLITSDHGGRPYNGPGCVGHFVHVSSVQPPAVNQMTSGGRYPSYDCAPAVLRSALLELGKDVPVGKLEAAAGTNNRFGTGWAGILNAASAYGLQPTRVNGGLPDAGWVMNPAWGGVLNPSHFAEYAAVSQHQWVGFEAGGVIPVSNPQPTSGTTAQQFKELGMVLYQGVDGSGHEWFVDAQGTLRERYLTPQGWVAGFTAPGCVPFSQVAHAVIHGADNVAAQKTDGTPLHVFYTGTSWAVAE